MMDVLLCVFLCMIIALLIDIALRITSVQKAITEHSDDKAADSIKRLVNS